jgi:hypothetical protein
MSYFWVTHPEALEFIKRQISEGASAAEVGTMLSAKYNQHVSRNAVIGVMNRHNLKATDERASKRGQGKRKKKAASDHIPRHKWSGPRTFKPAPSTYNQEVIEQNCSCNIHGLNDQKCHWPLGLMLAHPPFQYCGLPTLSRYPYCSYHMGRSIDSDRMQRYRERRRI